MANKYVWSAISIFAKNSSGCPRGNGKDTNKYAEVYKQFVRIYWIGENIVLKSNEVEYQLRPSVCHDKRNNYSLPELIGAGMFHYC